MKKPGTSASTRAVRDEVARLGPNEGHYRRVRLANRDTRNAPEPSPPAGATRAPRINQELEPPPPPVPTGAPEVRGSIAPNAPTSQPRRRWKATEIAAIASLGAVALSLLGLVLGALRPSRPALQVPRQRSEAVPPRAPNKPTRKR